MIIKMIVAIDLYEGISLNGKLPWKIKEELKFFRDKTIGHSVIYGRKTYDSMNSILDGRKNYILTRNRDLKVKDAEIIHEIESIVYKYKDSSNILYIIGGKSIYELFISYVEELIISQINKKYVCDTYVDMNLLLHDFNLIDVYLLDTKKDDIYISTYKRL